MNYLLAFACIVWFIFSLYLSFIIAHEDSDTTTLGDRIKIWGCIIILFVFMPGCTYFMVVDQRAGCVIKRERGVSAEEFKAIAQDNYKLCIEEEGTESSEYCDKESSKLYFELRDSWETDNGSYYDVTEGFYSEWQY